ncbi:hypothetical protein PF004_g23753 [Phytophthora fragariae]|uniref:Uncharacterized protein n=1 Tax=Phytophthora fragariae TaxID=53985 RepID=A0A6G0MX00_9STRA|nr:hypothetical protein PF004_g23753 [Phytophthora fragariae]
MLKVSVRVKFVVATVFAVALVFSCVRVCPNLAADDVFDARIAVWRVFCNYRSAEFSQNRLSLHRKVLF